MTTILNAQRRRAFASVLALSFGALLPACGGGGGADSPVAAQSPAPSSASTPTQVSNLDASTYVVGLMFETAAGRQFVNIGTAFAVRDNLLATTADVARAFLELARVAAANGARVIGASALQSETGLEFQLLRAVVHPTFADEQSPDVGLLVTQKALPNRLELATEQELSALKKGDPLVLNGIYDDVFDAGVAFEVGRTIPHASLFKGEVSSMVSFSAGAFVNNANEADKFQYAMVRSPGSDGSPVLHDGKVVAVHYSAITSNVLINQNGRVAATRITTGTGAWGVNVKHLRNVIKYFDSGLIAADRNFSLPPPDALIAATAANTVRSTAGRTYRGTMTNQDLPIANHTLTITVGQDLRVTGRATWPANAARTQFTQLTELTLTGIVQENGRITFVDNMPDVVPAIARGTYDGNLDTTNGKFFGHFTELDPTTNQPTHLGLWDIAP